MGEPAKALLLQPLPVELSKELMLLLPRTVLDEEEVALKEVEPLLLMEEDEVATCEAEPQGEPKPLLQPLALGL